MSHWNAVTFTHGSRIVISPYVTSPNGTATLKLVYTITCNCVMWSRSATPCKRQVGKDIYTSYSFFTSALYGGEWSASRTGRALPSVQIGQEAGWASELVRTQRLEEKIRCLCRGSNPSRPVCSKTLYSLSYPSSSNVIMKCFKSSDFKMCKILV
jgi:hypothetical protein